MPANTCGETDPQFCINEKVAYPGAKKPIFGTVLGIVNTASGIQYAVQWENSSSLNMFLASFLGKTIGCGTSRPQFCVNERAGYFKQNALGTIIGIVKKEDGVWYLIRWDDGDVTLITSEYLRKIN